MFCFVCFFLCLFFFYIKIIKFRNMLISTEHISLKQYSSSSSSKKSLHLHTNCYDRIPNPNIIFFSLIGLPALILICSIHALYHVHLPILYSGAYTKRVHNTEHALGYVCNGVLKNIYQLQAPVASSIRCAKYTFMLK